MRGRLASDRFFILFIYNLVIYTSSYSRALNKQHTHTHTDTHTHTRTHARTHARLVSADYLVNV